MDKKNKVRLVVLIIVTVILFALTTYGYFYVSNNQSDKNRLTGECFGTSFTGGESINLQNAMPQSFEESKKDEGYEFTLTNSCSTPTKYYILLNVKEGSFNPDFIDYSINNTSSNKLYNALLNTDRFSIDEGYSKSYIIGSGLLNSGSKTEKIRLWIDEDVNQDNLAANSSFTGQIQVVGEVSSMLGVDKIKNLVSGENTSSTDVITKEAPSGSLCTNTLAYDGTVDNNLRYVGANPCNYVSFNNELWRIIGVMNNVDDGTGNKETRLKIIRKDSLGSYSWDTSENNINDGTGINDWTQADLMQELNTDYLNTSLVSNKLWYNGRNNLKTVEYNYLNGLKKETQTQIKDAKWYLGGFHIVADRITTKMYNLERQNNVWGKISGQTCDDIACPRATEWTGKIALIYPSDYGYATSGGETTTRNDCIKTVSTHSWDKQIYEDCNDNDWLSGTSNDWLLSPDSTFNNVIFYITTAVFNGTSYNQSAFYNRNVYPSVYMKPEISIISGEGTETNPYILK